MSAPLLKASNVCEQLGVSRAWLYAAAADGRIPSIRLGGPDGPLRFVQTDIDDWIARARAGWQVGDTPTATLRRAGS